jgi:hypothetical protein
MIDEKLIREIVDLKDSYEAKMAHESVAYYWTVYEMMKANILTQGDLHETPEIEEEHLLQNMACIAELEKNPAVRLYLQRIAFEAMVQGFQMGSEYTSLITEKMFRVKVNS